MTRACNELFQCCTTDKIDPIICKITSISVSKLENNQLEENNLLLYLKKGDRVMITSNLSTDCGIVNGSLAIVEFIVYQTLEDFNKQSLPSGIVLKLLNNELYNLNYNSTSLLIKPITEQVSIQAEKATTEKLGVPLILSYCLTIHKTQSLTLEQVLVLADHSLFARGLLYTAFSRVREKNNLFCLISKPLCKIKQLVGGMLPSIKKELDLFKSNNILK